MYPSLHTGEFPTVGVHAIYTCSSPFGVNSFWDTSKVSRGNLECRVIRNDSGIDLGYYEITDHLDILFHLKVGAGVGSTISSHLAAGCSLSQRKAKKCWPNQPLLQSSYLVKLSFLLGTLSSPELRQISQRASGSRGSTIVIWLNLLASLLETCP